MSEAPPDRKSSKVIYTGRVFTITVDEVAYPDGRLVSMDVVRHPGSVVLLPMTAPDRLLLVRQYRYVVDRWLWELPAGTREPNEALEATALRECHEEVAKIAGRDQRPGDLEAHQDPDELLTVKEFSVADVREMIRAGEIVDLKTAVGLTLV